MPIDKYKTMINALQLIALPFEEQIKLLPEFVCHADEIALFFDEARGLVADDDGLFSVDAQHSLDELDKRFDEMSGRPVPWSLGALENSREWFNLRILAKIALDQLNEPLSPPSIDFVTFVRGK